MKLLEACKILSHRVCGWPFLYFSILATDSDRRQYSKVSPQTNFWIFFLSAVLGFFFFWYSYSYSITGHLWIYDNWRVMLSFVFNLDIILVEESWKCGLCYLFWRGRGSWIGTYDFGFFNYFWYESLILATKMWLGLDSRTKYLTSIIEVIVDCAT